MRAGGDGGVDLRRRGHAHALDDGAGRRVRVDDVALFYLSRLGPSFLAMAGLAEAVPMLGRRMALPFRSSDNEQVSRTVARTRQSNAAQRVGAERRCGDRLWAVGRGSFL